MPWAISAIVLVILLIAVIFIARIAINETIDLCIDKNIENFYRLKVVKIFKGHLLISYIYSADIEQKIVDYSRYQDLGIIGVTIYVTNKAENFVTEKYNIEEVLSLEEPKLLPNVYFYIDAGDNLSWLPQ